jgi:LPXTG-motif cell wall-anchored protein
MAFMPPQAMPETPVIPETNSMILLAGGLLALGALVGLRRVRRRDK